MSTEEQKALEDRVVVRLPATRLELYRSFSIPQAHEITVVIPRVEIKFCFSLFGLKISREVNLNSITVVDAPRPRASNGKKLTFSPSRGLDATEPGAAFSGSKSRSPVKIIYR
jgi:hypothetical protein